MIVGSGSLAGEAERGWDGMTVQGMRRWARLADPPVPVLVCRCPPIEEMPGGGRTKLAMYIFSCIWLW